MNFLKLLRFQNKGPSDGHQHDTSHPRFAWILFQFQNEGSEESDKLAIIIRTLSREFPFDGRVLVDAVGNTFKRRGTNPPPGKPAVFTADFFDDVGKKKQWAAFCEKNKTYVAELRLQEVCGHIERFLMPVVEAVQAGTDLALKRAPENLWMQF